MKKPTVKQSIILKEKLNLNYEEWFIKVWREFKGGIEIKLVNRKNGEKLDKVIDI